MNPTKVKLFNLMRDELREVYKGHSNASIAKSVGVAPQTIHDFFNNNTNSMSVARAIAKNDKYIKALMFAINECSKRDTVRHEHIRYLANKEAARRKRLDMRKLNGRITDNKGDPITYKYLHMARSEKETHNIAGMSKLPAGLQAMAGYIHE